MEAYAQIVEDGCAKVMLQHKDAGARVRSAMMMVMAAILRTHVFASPVARCLELVFKCHMTVTNGPSGVCCGACGAKFFYFAFSSDN